MISSGSNNLYPHPQDFICQYGENRMRQHTNVKKLLVNLHNKLSTLDNRIEISFESITTKIH